VPDPVDPLLELEEVSLLLLLLLLGFEDTPHWPALHA
jgi:hypothetical protein